MLEKIVLLLYQGLYLGKEKYATIVLEAVVDNNLWFWHSAFGFVGSCNNINILDVSPLYICFLDGSHAKIDFDYSIGEFEFNKLFFIWLMVSILSLLNLSKTIQIPLTKKEKQFHWMARSSQEGC